MNKLVFLVVLLLSASGCTVHTHSYTCTGVDCPQPRTVVVRQAPAYQQRVAYTQQSTQPRALYVTRSTNINQNTNVVHVSSTSNSTTSTRTNTPPPRTPAAKDRPRKDKVRRMVKCKKLPNGMKKCMTKHHEN